MGGMGEGNSCDRACSLDIQQNCGFYYFSGIIAFTKFQLRGWGLPLDDSCPPIPLTMVCQDPRWPPSSWAYGDLSPHLCPLLLLHPWLPASCGGHLGWEERSLVLHQSPLPGWQYPGEGIAISTATWHSYQQCQEIMTG